VCTKPVCIKTYAASRLFTTWRWRGLVVNKRALKCFQIFYVCSIKVLVVAYTPPGSVVT